MIASSKQPKGCLPDLIFFPAEDYHWKRRNVTIKLMQENVQPFPATVFIKTKLFVAVLTPLFSFIPIDIGYAL